MTSNPEISFITVSDDSVVEAESFANCRQNSETGFSLELVELEDTLDSNSRFEVKTSSPRSRETFNLQKGN